MGLTHTKCMQTSQVHEQLAAKIIRSIKAPHSYSVERNYARHVALMVSIYLQLRIFIQ